MDSTRVPPKRRRTATAASAAKAEPLDFKSRLAKAKSLTDAMDDGYLELDRDERLDYCDLPMILEKWETKVGDRTYNGKAHCRVWAMVQVSDRPDPVFVKFRDMNDAMALQLLEFERCRTFRDVAVMMVAREFLFNNNTEVGYEYTFEELKMDELPDEVIPPAVTEPTTDEPPY